MNARSMLDHLVSETNNHIHLVIQVLQAQERPPASCVWPELCWEPPWKTLCWSSTLQTTGETPAEVTLIKREKKTDDQISGLTLYSFQVSRLSERWRCKSSSYWFKLLLFVRTWESESLSTVCLQRNWCGEEQDQDVCSAESHTAQRTTQDHHPGRSRQVRRQVYHRGSERYSRLLLII